MAIAFHTVLLKLLYALCNFCYNLLTLIMIQISMIYDLPWNTK